MASENPEEGDILRAAFEAVRMTHVEHTLETFKQDPSNIGRQSACGQALEDLQAIHGRAGRYDNSTQP